MNKTGRALSREAELSAEQIASGITALGRASHAQDGYYTHAFFGLSIGLERLMKLIIIADHAIGHSGAYPTNAYLKNNYGHDLGKLKKRCTELVHKHRTDQEYSDEPNTEIHKNIIRILSEFAHSSRYYNLNYITQNTSQTPEPIQAWWERVGIPILNHHYTATQRRKDQASATLMEKLIGNNSHIFHFAEDGKPITNIETLMTQGAATKVVQKYGWLYSLQIVRWLSYLLADLSFKGAYKNRLQPLLGLDEPFAIFRNDDPMLKNRKTWSIYRP